MRVVLEKFPLVNKKHVFGKRYRSSFEIMASILEIAVGGVSRFVIANRLNTNYAQLQRYLSYLVKMGFIDVETDGRQISYKTNGKGLEFLRLYNALLEMFLEDAEAEAYTNVVCECAGKQTTVGGRGRRNFGL